MTKEILIPEFILGVDPGASGAVSVIETASLSHVESADFKCKPSEAKSLALILDSMVKKYGAKGTCALAIEEVHAIFGTGAKSTFNFGFNLGLLHAVLQLNSIPFHLVKPKVWQNTLGLPTFKDTTVAERKTMIAEAVEAAIPTADIRGPKGGAMDGRSDALGIAHHLYVQYTSEGLAETNPYMVYTL